MALLQIEIKSHIEKDTTTNNICIYKFETMYQIMNFYDIQDIVHIGLP